MIAKKIHGRLIEAKKPRRVKRFVNGGDGSVEKSPPAQAAAAEIAVDPQGYLSGKSYKPEFAQKNANRNIELPQIAQNEISNLGQTKFGGDQILGALNGNLGNGLAAFGEGLEGLIAQTSSRADEKGKPLTQKLGLANGGRLNRFAIGGDQILGALNGVMDMTGNAAQQAQTDYTDDELKAAITQAANRNIETQSSYDELEQDMENYRDARTNLNYRDMRSNSYMQDFANSLTASAKGLSSGSQFGAGVGVIGAIAGGISSAIGSIFGRKKARSQARKINAAAELGNERATEQFQTSADQIADETRDKMLRNYAAEGGAIHIDPKNEGKFTAAAKRAGMSVQEYAGHILANKDRYSPLLVKRANFARNAAKWHAEGGPLVDVDGPLGDDPGPLGDDPGPLKDYPGPLTGPTNTIDLGRNRSIEYTSGPYGFEILAEGGRVRKEPIQAVAPPMYDDRNVYGNWYEPTGTVNGVWGIERSFANGGPFTAPKQHELGSVGSSAEANTMALGGFAPFASVANRTEQERGGVAGGNVMAGGGATRPFGYGGSTNKLGDGGDGKKRWFDREQAEIDALGSALIPPIIYFPFLKNRIRRWAEDFITRDTDNRSPKIMSRANFVADPFYVKRPKEEYQGIQDNYFAARDAYLMSEPAREKYLTERGFVKVGTPQNDEEAERMYGIVNRHAQDINGKRGAYMPVYQTGGDYVSPDRLHALGNYDYKDPTAWEEKGGLIGAPQNNTLIDFGNATGTIYVDDNGTMYQKVWDVNDYESKRNGHYSNLMVDTGTPFVVTTGVRPIYMNMDGENYPITIDDFRNGYISYPNLDKDAILNAYDKLVGGRRKERALGGPLLSGTPKNRINATEQSRGMNKFDEGGLTGEKKAWAEQIYPKAIELCKRTAPDDATESDIMRQARFLMSRWGEESDYGQSNAAKQNNFGGLKRNGELLSYDSPEEFMEYAIANLDANWPEWRKARSNKEFIDAIIPVHKDQKTREYVLNEGATRSYIGLDTPREQAEIARALPNMNRMFALAKTLGWGDIDEYDDIYKSMTYDEYMRDVANENYKAWGFATPKEAYEYAINDAGYNYKDYFDNTKKADLTYYADDHWPDTYKTASHPTFSNESKYSGVVSEQNPDGIVGGTWVGETFFPSFQQLMPTFRYKYSNGGKYAEGGSLNRYSVGQEIEISDRQAKQLKKLGYDFVAV